MELSRLSRVSGTPMWLLRFPEVESTLYFIERTLVISSFVVVLPLEPVSAITGILKCSRWYAASSCRVSNTLSTRKKRLLLQTEGLSTTAYWAPASIACAAKSLPSKLSPLRAKKRDPGIILRLSVETFPEEMKISCKCLICSMCSMCSAYLTPVDPNPPWPRWLSSKESLSTHSTFWYFATIIWAILSPGCNVYS
ncbi:hypothetical protein SDC9_132904 [bioreactor metagenome]|uniref:Uncharacterized protein n=1 Tax=bioreactor metagenome TaxID=1076179 RepID=A0A645DB71_9ZZZZ